MNTQPLLKIRDKNISIAVFCENITNSKTGEIYPRYSFAIQRSYKDKEGEYVNQTINAYRDEVLILANTLTRAYNAICAYIGKDTEKNTKKSSDKTTPQSSGLSPEDDDIPF